jgi:hypothetical protein
LAASEQCMQFCRRIQRCVKPVHASHSMSVTHEETH